MNFPLSIFDVSLWLAVATIILLTTSELLYSSSYYSSRIVLDRRLLRYIGVGCGFAFLATVIMRMVGFP